MTPLLSLKNRIFLWAVSNPELLFTCPEVARKFKAAPNTAYRTVASLIDEGVLEHLGEYAAAPKTSPARHYGLSVEALEELGYAPEECRAERRAARQKLWRL